MTKNFKKVKNYEVKSFVEAFDTMLLKEEDSTGFDMRSSADSLEDMYGECEA